jgi:hypothetical protein
MAPAVEGVHLIQKDGAGAIQMSDTDEQEV